jgi:tetratricopeptide (TPR) repeat protein
MEIRIQSAGKEIGPYSESQVRQYLNEGLIAPSDLATFTGRPDWQALEQLLARLPAPPTSATAPAGVSTRDSGGLPAERALAASRAKRGPIVIQPPFANSPPAASPPKKTRSGKVALTIEPLRPTTQLPDVAKFVAREEKKSARSAVETGPLSPGNFFKKPEPEPQAPTTPPEPVGQPVDTEEALPAPAPDVPSAGYGRRNLPPEPEPPHPDEQEPLPNAILYAGTVIGLLILFVVLAAVYLIWHFSTPAPRGDTSSATPSANSVASAGVPTDPHTAAEYSARGLARQNEGNLDGALSDYDQAVDLDPRNVEATYRRAVARQTKGNWSGALADYNTLLTLDPNNADAFSNRGFVKQARGDLDGALADYAEALLRDPKIAVAYYNIGLIKAQQKDLDGGIDAYNHALDLNPKLTRAYYNRGNAKSAEGNLDGAIADYTQALALDPQIAMAYFARGFARQSKGDATGALADYSQALVLDPKMAAAYYNRGQIKVQRGDFEGAISDSSWAIELDPKNAEAYCDRGLAEFGKGYLEGAATDLRKYCDMAPRDGGSDSARLYLWIVAMEVNPRGTANEDLATALENDWNSSPEELTSKIANFLLGHIRESELIADAASPDVSREPGQYCKVWYFAGMKRLVAGDTATALTDLQKSLATDQKNFCEYLFARAQLAALGQNRQASTQPTAP